MYAEEGEVGRKKQRAITGRYIRGQLAATEVGMTAGTELRHRLEKPKRASVHIRRPMT